MANFWNIVKEVIERADIVLEVLDARLVGETRNNEAEMKVEKLGKKIIYIINKCDLVSREYMENFSKIKEMKDVRPFVFVSSTKRLGSKKLRDQIMIEATRMKHDFPMIRVGVIGYPNTGKSSVINMLKGRKSAPTSSYSGFTKGIQEVKASKKITLFDSPGVIPFMEKDEVKHSLIGSRNPQKIKDPEIVFYSLNSHLKYRGLSLARYYGAEEGADEEETLENIAIKKRMLKKGGKADTERVARGIIDDWQKGKIR